MGAYQPFTLKNCVTGLQNGPKTSTELLQIYLSMNASK